jgi:hypothetical protein
MVSISRGSIRSLGRHASTRSDSHRYNGPWVGRLWTRNRRPDQRRSRQSGSLAVLGRCFPSAPQGARSQPDVAFGEQECTGSSSPVTGTCEPRQITLRYLPILLRCQDFPPNARSNSLEPGCSEADEVGAGCLYRSLEDHTLWLRDDSAPTAAALSAGGAISERQLKALRFNPTPRDLFRGNTTYVGWAFGSAPSIRSGLRDNGIG